MLSGFGISYFQFCFVYLVLKQVKCEVIVKKTSQDASDARYGAVPFGLHCI